MHGGGDSDWERLGAIERKARVMDYVREEVRRLVARGTATPHAWQARRYLPYDSVRVDNTIVTIITDPSLYDTITVTDGRRPYKDLGVTQQTASVWLDENGRVITD